MTTVTATADTRAHRPPCPRGAAADTGGDDLRRLVDAPRRQSSRPVPRRSRGPRPHRWHILPAAGGSSVVLQQYSAGRPMDTLPVEARLGRLCCHQPPRLTTRGRVVACLVAQAVIVGALGAGRATNAASADTRGAIATVVVQRGQSLWQIAGEVAPDADRRSTIATIARLNSGLRAELHPGQTLRVPMP